MEDGSRPGKAAVPKGDMQHHLKTRCGAVVCSFEVSGTDRADIAVNERWSPAEHSATKPRGMWSGLGLPQGRGCPCHAQSTTGIVGDATGLRSSRKTTSL